MIARLPILPLLAVILTLSVAACGDDSEEAGAGDNGDGTAPQAIELSARDYEFSPATIEAAAGEETAVTVTNDGGAPHTFTIDSLAVDAEIAPGETQTVSFTPTGDDTFYCRFHIGFAMTGLISTGEGNGSASDPTPTEDPAGEFSY